MGKETIRYWKSANDIIVVNYSVHSNNQNEYMQAYRHTCSRPSARVVLLRKLMHLIAINQCPALPNNFYMYIRSEIMFYGSADASP